MVKYVFGVFGALAILAGVLVFFGAGVKESVVLEIEALMLFLIAAVLIVGAEIIAAIEQLKVESKRHETEVATSEGGFDPDTGMKIGG